MILGHEIAGTVEAVGPGVTGLAPGTVVAVNPSRPCGVCDWCRAGLSNHCTDMRFLGSAMRSPHVQGGFRELLTCLAIQAVPVGPGVSVNAAAFAEPLAVCLHAVSQAGPLDGARVLITGAGPIGVLTAAAARHAGAAEIVVTDVIDEPLAFARPMGATATANIAGRDPWLDRDRRRASTWSSRPRATPRRSSPRLDWLAPARHARPDRQHGRAAELPIGRIVSRELTLRGTFRFHGEFATAVALISDGAIDVAPLLTAVLPLAEATPAFELAADKRRTMKVQLAFDGWPPRDPRRALRPHRPHRARSPAPARGIGLAIARGLAGAGARVVLNGRDAAPARHRRGDAARRGRRPRAPRSSTSPTTPPPPPAVAADRARRRPDRHPRQQRRHAAPRPARGFRRGRLVRG